MFQKKSSKVGKDLLDWYDQNKRDLPWRKIPSDMYEVWVSEIMAQQTRIETMKPYYERFIERFPNIVVLAKADIKEILMVWSGLGYYQRAHKLHETAKQVVRVYGGKFPRNLKELQSLPGIGPYTAGAMLSIVYDNPIPAIDGNVRRVVARYLASSSLKGSVTLDQHAKDFIKGLMKNHSPSLITQSLMELGALVCLPKHPNCCFCPLKKNCLANQKGQAEKFPRTEKRSPIKKEHLTILVLIGKNNQILVQQRTQKLLQGLYGFLDISGHISEQELIKYFEHQKWKAKRYIYLGHFIHRFTHRVWDMEGFLCILEESIELEGFEKISINEMDQLAFPTAYKHYIKKLKQILHDL